MAGFRFNRTGSGSTEKSKYTVIENCIAKIGRGKSPPARGNDVSLIKTNDFQYRSFHHSAPKQAYSLFLRSIIYINITLSSNL